jgi:hypothetical protein
MERPSLSDKEAREKWYRLLYSRIYSHIDRDAWKSHSGVSRTDAKRAYITNLLASMRKYASDSPSSHDLVDELEFVWDQVKNNVSPISTPSPTHETGLGISKETPLSFMERFTTSSPGKAAQPPRITTFRPGSTDLRHLTSSPLSHSVDDSSDDEEPYVDAPDSQVAAEEGRPLLSPPLPPPKPQVTHATSTRLSKPPEDVKSPTRRPHTPNTRKQYRARIENTLTRLTAEVAALREQLDLSRSLSFSSRFFSPIPQNNGLSFWAQLALSGLYFLAKVIIFDVVVLVLVLIWMRRKKDGRLEGAIRVLLGDAVAVVQRSVREASRGVERVGRVVGKSVKNNSKTLKSSLGSG